MSTQPSLPKRTTCRVCGSLGLTHLFSLGIQHISDFVTEDKVGTSPTCPISLCLCNQCTLVQQEYTAPQDFMYTRHYWYKSGTTETMRKALADIVDTAMDVVRLDPGDVVLDIGSNDGTLLRCYPKELNLFTAGVEPAANLREEGRKGISCFINEFWSAEAYFLRVNEVDAEDVWSNKAKVITAIGMFYDLEEPNFFIADIAKVLHPEGVFIAQLMCLKQTIEQGDVGNFAHEHLEFYSLDSLDYLMKAHGLQIYDIEENKVNGGSYRLFIRHLSNSPKDYPSSPAAIRRGKAFVRESEMGLDKVQTYTDFFQRLETNKEKVTEFIRREVLKDKIVWVYGASTKGNVILQYYGLDKTLIEFACDKSPEKWNKYTSTGIQIGSEELMRKAGVDYLLILPYAFTMEFYKREQEWLEKGGKFIIPLPIPHTIEVDQVDLAVKWDWYPQDRMPLFKVVQL